MVEGASLLDCDCYLLEGFLNRGVLELVGGVDEAWDAVVSVLSGLAPPHSEVALPSEHVHLGHVLPDAALVLLALFQDQHIGVEVVEDLPLAELVVVGDVGGNCEGVLLGYGRVEVEICVPGRADHDVYCPVEIG